LQRSLGKNNFVVRRQRSELVGMRFEWQVGEFGDLLGRTLGKLGMRIQSGADRSAADGQIVKTLDGHLDALDVALQQARPAGKLLPNRERSGILQVGAADLYNVLKFPSFGIDFIMYFFNCRNEPNHGRRSRNVHGRRERVVRRLRHVHMVVRVNRILRAEDSAGNFNGAVGDDLVDVHVGLGAAAGLPDAERELIVQLSRDDLVRRLDNQFRFVSG